MRKKILKSFGLIFLLLLVSGAVYALRMDFRWSDGKFLARIAKASVAGEVVHYNNGKSIIRYVRSGDIEAQPVVFIHGAPGSGKDFARYMADADLAGKANLITVDRPGYGQSSYGHSMASIRDQAFAIMGMVPEGSILVGHSFGGPVASAIAMYAPSKVKELILLAPAVDPGSEQQFLINRVFGLPALRWMLSGALKVALEEKLSHVQALEEIIDGWDRIAQPVTIAHGKKDNIVPFENTNFLERVLVNSEPEIFSPSGMNHIMIWTEYKWVKDLLLEKLNCDNSNDGLSHNFKIGKRN